MIVIYIFLVRYCRKAKIGAIAEVEIGELPKRGKKIGAVVQIAVDATIGKRRVIANAVTRKNKVIANDVIKIRRATANAVIRIKVARIKRVIRKRTK